MAHEIAFRIVSGVRAAQFASTQKEWHFFDTNHNIILPTDTPEEIVRKCGMDYKIKKAFVRYATARLENDTPAHALGTMKDKVVLFRDDTGASLSVVSDSYQVVQPVDLMTTITDVAHQAGITLRAAGVLFNGRKYFATGTITDAVVEAVDGAGGKDSIVQHLVIHSSADGSSRTEARWTGVAAICDNTLRAAMSDAAFFSITHRTAYKKQEVQRVAEQAHKEYGAYMEMARALAKAKCVQADAEEFTRLLLMKSKVGAAESIITDSDKVRESYVYKSIMSLFNGAGKGAMLETRRETQWGWLNAVTQHVDHETRARTPDARLANAMWGPGDALKQSAYALLTQ